MIFDSHIVLDWSARTAPSPAAPSRDAIWWAQAGEEPIYARTRAEAEAQIVACLDAARSAGRRVLLGVDFPLGYPRGVASHVAGKASAFALWDWIAARTRADETNSSNHYEIACEINRTWPGRGPFWGRPQSRPYADIPTRASSRHGDLPPERRHVEAAVPRAKTVWQLAYAGSVGSQALTGLPMLNRLRARGDVAVWPFEAPDAPIVLAEVYPSLFADTVTRLRGAGEILDRAQVRVVSRLLAALDAEGGLATLFDLPFLDPQARLEVEREEAWILGAGHDDLAGAVAERLA